MIEINLEMMPILESKDEECNYILSIISTEFFKKNELLSEKVFAKPNNKIENTNVNSPFGLEFDPVSQTGRSFEKDPYLKVFSTGSKFGVGNKPNERCRISMTVPVYVSHNNPAATWKLSTKEKKLLIDLLSTTVLVITKDNKSYMTVWEFMFWYSNNVAMVKLDPLPMPDYMQL